MESHREFIRLAHCDGIELLSSHFAEDNVVATQSVGAVIADGFV
jgi:hypothetical protein